MCVCMCVFIVFCCHTHVDSKIWVPTCSPQLEKTIMVTVFAKNDLFRSNFTVFELRQN